MMLIVLFHSGILECPCTTRKVKVLDAYKVSPESKCAMEVETLRECESAVKALALTSAPVLSESTPNMPAGCLATVSLNGEWSAVFNGDLSSSTPCATAASNVALAGTMVVGSVNVSFLLDPANESIQLGLSCESNGAWFGVGLNQTEMDGTYAVVVDGTGAVSEHSLGMHAAGTQLPSTITVVSNKLVDAVRTVVLRLPTGAGAAAGAPDWSKVQPGSFPIITAVGSTPTLSYHKFHAAGTVVLGSVGHPSCLCRDASANSGTIDGARFNPGVCAPYPTSELLNTTYGGMVNPICNISA